MTATDLADRLRRLADENGDKGGPDLLLARDGVTLHPELKTDTGEVGPDQKLWAKHLGGTYRLWRPKMWDEILKELR